MKHKIYQKKLKNASLFVLSFLLLFLFSPSIVEGAILYLVPESQTENLDDNFLAEIKLDTEGEEINALGASLTFPADSLEFIDFSKGDSILSLWVQNPSIIEGTISFSGGVPGGFKGEGRIGRVIFKGKKEGKAIVNFKEDCSVLLNDGLGTPATLITKGATFTVLAEKLEVPRDEWQEELEKDKILPEPFEIKIAQEPSIFEGKYFIVFSTIDKQTGIDRYEIKEGKRDWKVGESPYLLEDQSLKSKILVKVIDKAGNERITEIAPPVKISWKDILPWILVLIIIGALLWWLIRRIKIRKT